MPSRWIAGYAALWAAAVIVASVIADAAVAIGVACVGVLLPLVPYYWWREMRPPHSR